MRLAVAPSDSLRGSLVPGGHLRASMLPYGALRAGIQKDAFRVSIQAAI
jgi:hypothetical protein